MTPSERDISILKHIANYCEEITDAIEKHNLTLDSISSDNVYKNALSMSILQIGELANVLSKEFRTTHDTIPWHEIERMRDKAAHHYWTFELDILWETVTDDIVPLKEYCENCIKEFNNKD